MTGASDVLRSSTMGDFRVIADHRGVNRSTLHDVVRRCTTLSSGPISMIFCDSHSCGVSKVDRAMSYDVTYDIVRRRDSSYGICAIDVR